VLAQILTLQPPDPAAVLLGALGVNTPEVRRGLDAVTRSPVSHADDGGRRSRVADQALW
jgi:hypothetical protein